MPLTGRSDDELGLEITHHKRRGKKMRQDLSELEPALQRMILEAMDNVSRACLKMTNFYFWSHPELVLAQMSTCERWKITCRMERDLNASRGEQTPEWRTCGLCKALNSHDGFRRPKDRCSETPRMIELLRLKSPFEWSQWPFHYWWKPPYSKPIDPENRYCWRHT